MSDPEPIKYQVLRKLQQVKKFGVPTHDLLLGPKEIRQLEVELETAHSYHAPEMSEYMSGEFLGMRIIPGFFDGINFEVRLQDARFIGWDRFRKGVE